MIVAEKNESSGANEYVISKGRRVTLSKGCLMINQTFALSFSKSAGRISTSLTATWTNQTRPENPWAVTLVFFGVRACVGNVESYDCKSRYHHLDRIAALTKFVRGFKVVIPPITWHLAVSWVMYNISCLIAWLIWSLIYFRLLHFSDECLSLAEIEVRAFEFKK